MKRAVALLPLLACWGNNASVTGNWHFESGSATPFSFNLKISTSADAGKVDVASGPSCSVPGTLDSDRSGHVDNPQQCTLAEGEWFAFVSYDAGWTTVVVDELTFVINADDRLVTSFRFNNGAATPKTTSLMNAKGSRY